MIPALENKETFVLMAVLFFYSFSDLRSRRINWWVLPCIALFAIHNDRILSSIAAYLFFATVGLFDFSRKRFLNDSDVWDFLSGATKTLYRGGDAYIMTLVYAALGITGLIVIACSWAAVFLYRAIFRDSGALPYVPFLTGTLALHFVLYRCQ